MATVYANLVERISKGRPRIMIFIPVLLKDMLNRTVKAGYEYLNPIRTWRGLNVPMSEVMIVISCPPAEIAQIFTYNR